MVLQLELGHSFQSKSTRQTLLSASPQRHDYNCWGMDQEDVSDCVLVRHAGYTITVSFYICTSPPLKRLKRSGEMHSVALKTIAWPFKGLQGS